MSIFVDTCPDLYLRSHICNLLYFYIFGSRALIIHMSYFYHGIQRQFLGLFFLAATALLVLCQGSSSFFWLPTDPPLDRTPSHFSDWPLILRWTGVRLFFSSTWVPDRFLTPISSWSADSCHMCESAPCRSISAALFFFSFFLSPIPFCFLPVSCCVAISLVSHPWPRRADVCFLFWFWQYMFFELILQENVFLMLFAGFFLRKVLLLSFLVLALMLRMVLLSASIVIFLRLLVLSYSPPMFPLTSRLRLSQLPPITLTFSLLRLFRWCFFWASLWQGAWLLQPLFFGYVCHVLLAPHEH